MTKTSPSIAEILDMNLPYGPSLESDAEARAWLKTLGAEAKLFIGGSWRKAKSGENFPTLNPADGEVLAVVAKAGAADVDAAVKAAAKALPGWAGLSGHERARKLYALARLLQRHARLFAVLETLDTGKTIRESRDVDIPLAIRHFYHHAGWAQLRDSEFPDQEPVGVCGQIIPWNFPLLMLAWKLAPALAMGNTVVLKPAEETPLTALLFGEICQKAGIPPGVVNILTGEGETGAALAAHPGVAKLAFTGSTEVGRLLREATAGSGKGLTLELGGKSPFIVFEDADLDAAVEGVVESIWFNQGQVCCAGSRLLVQEGVEAEFLTRLKRRMEKLRLGPPLDKAVDMGPLISRKQMERVRDLVALGLNEGAEIHQTPGGAPEGACYYPPTLLTGVQPAGTLAQVEIFGPVLVAMSFRTPQEAVEMANHSPYGLAASLWSESVSKALDVASKLNCGVVWVNSANLFDASVGFGGVKESGYGREGGREGLAAYLKPKWRAKLKPLAASPAPVAAVDSAPSEALDRTPKLYIGGKQTRPDGGYSRAVYGASGALLGEIGEGSRKDVRNAVEAARKAESWAETSGHARAQILYYVAENLEARAAEFAARIGALTGRKPADCAREVADSVARLFSYGAWADKYEGAVHRPPLKGAALAVHDPVGVIGAICPEDPGLLGLISLMAPAMAMGNRVILVPSATQALLATDVYQILDTSDVPGGVVNIVTGDRAALGLELAKHHAVDALWAFGPAESLASFERASAGNLKRVWTEPLARDWRDAAQGEGREFLAQAVQVKNIWVPWGA